MSNTDTITSLYEDSFNSPALTMLRLPGQTSRRSHTWHEFAACADPWHGLGAEAWTGTRPRSGIDSQNTALQQAAIIICGTCPVIEACRVWADAEPYAASGLVVAGEYRSTIHRRHAYAKPHVPARCGTTAAHARHRRAGETPCEPCHQASLKYRREQAKRRKTVTRYDGGMA